MKTISLSEIKDALIYGKNHGFKLFPEIHSEDDIYKAKMSPATSKLTQEVIKDAEEILKKIDSTLPFRRFVDFLENGNRINYERLFFDSKRKLHILVLAEILERKGRFIEAIEERLWTWCNEYSWELPAHVALTKEEIESNGVEADEDIALFAAETGFYFAEILSLIKDKLHPLLVYRLEKEIHKRIINSYEKRAFKWEDWQMNWSAVCAGGVGCAAIYCMEDDKRLARLIHRVIKSMDAYMTGFDDDGITTEGLGYWQYGFSFYLYFAQLLKERTCGKIDLMHSHDKVKRIAELPLYLQFPNKSMINFSDTPGDTWLGEYSMLTYLSKTFKINQYIFPEENSIQRDHTSKWALMARNIFWCIEPVQENSKAIKTGCYYFEESQWFIDRKTDAKGRFCAFAAKGGHNDEPHNHNDLGHFILHCNGETIFCDLGAPEYVKDFFREKRYEFLQASSKGHSVPIINGSYQASGKKYQSHVLKVETLDCCDSLMQLDLKAAYENDKLRKYYRTFNWNSDRLELHLTDEFAFKDKDNLISEVFITHLNVIIIKPGEIRIIGEHIDAFMYFDSQAVCEVIPEKYKNHFSMDKEVNRIIIQYAADLEKRIDISIKVMHGQQQKPIEGRDNNA